MIETAGIFQVVKFDTSSHIQLAVEFFVASEQRRSLGRFISRANGRRGQIAIFSSTMIRLHLHLVRVVIRTCRIVLIHVR